MSETTIEQELRREAREGAGASWRASIALLGQLVSPYRGLATATLLAMLFDLSGMLLIPTQLSAMINTAVTTQDANEFLAHGALMLAAALVFYMDTAPSHVDLFSFFGVDNMDALF